MEVLFASLIVAVCIIGVVSMWAFAMNTTRGTDNSGAGYQIARRTLEKYKSMGFYNAPEAAAGSPITFYYDVDGGGESASSTGKYFRAETTIVSDILETKNGVTSPADNAVRAVIVTVYRVSDNRQMFKSGTLLARSGI